MCERGLWLPHSWGVDDCGMIETTSSRRVHYYGFVLTDPEALKFAFESLPGVFFGRLLADAVPGSWVGELVRGIAAGRESVLAPADPCRVRTARPGRRPRGATERNHMPFSLGIEALN
jgi:hypothetical protein